MGRSPLACRETPDRPTGTTCAQVDRRGYCFPLRLQLALDGVKRVYLPWFGLWETDHDLISKRLRTPVWPDMLGPLSGAVAGDLTGSDLLGRDRHFLLSETTVI